MTKERLDYISTRDFDKRRSYLTDGEIEELLRTGTKGGSVSAKGKDQPLSCEIENDQLVIRIGVETLKFCSNEPSSDNLKDGWLITDPAGFSKDVIHELQKEREDGSTILTDLLIRPSKKQKTTASALLSQTPAQSVEVLDGILSTLRWALNYGDFSNQLEVLENFEEAIADLQRLRGGG